MTRPAHLMLKLQELTGDKGLADDIYNVFVAAYLEVLLERNEVTFPFLGTFSLVNSNRSNKLSSAPILILKFKQVLSPLSTFFVRYGFSPSKGFKKFFTPAISRLVSEQYTKFFEGLSEDDKKLIKEHESLVQALKVIVGSQKFTLNKVTLEDMYELFQIAKETERFQAFNAIESPVAMLQKQAVVTFSDDIEEARKATLEDYKEAKRRGVNGKIPSN